MLKLLLASFAIAVLAALWSIAEGAPRPIDAPHSRGGVWTASFAVANGYDGRVVSAKEYADFVKSGSCLSSSHVSVWPYAHEVSFVCEL